MSRSLALAILLTLASVACAAEVSPSEPDIESVPAIDDGVLDLPPDRLVAFDTISIVDGQAAVSFIGGKPFDPANPCTHAYAGFADAKEDVLSVAVVDVTPKVPLNEQRVCTSEGHARSVMIELRDRFDGVTVHDLAGYVHFLAAPAGLVELRGLPEGWAMLTQRDVEDSPTGRWQRTYGHAPDVDGREPRVDLYQAFGGPAQVSGGEEMRSVSVGASAAILYRQPESRELVLVWTFEADGLALVADERDFDADALIRLAESGGR